MMPTKRTRTRREAARFDKEKIVNGIIEKYDKEMESQREDRNDLIQRYAKYRGWVERTSAPWDDASNAHIPMMVTDSLRIQDTLNNAVMSSRPIIHATAFHESSQPQEENVDNMIDFQVFVEQDGEESLGVYIDNFVNVGTAVSYVPWVRDFKTSFSVRIHPPIPEVTQIETEQGIAEVEVEPVQYFQEIVNIEFPGEEFEVKNQGWTWNSEEKTLEFYTRKNGDVELVIQEQAEVFNGPRWFVKDFEDVIAPRRADNLQAPGPSNPHGAAWVCFRDYPEIEEIKRLRKNGFYEFVTKKDIEAMENVQAPIGSDEDAVKLQKDEMEGTTAHLTKPHKLTRLLCFEQIDINNDGIKEDVVLWLIKETQALLKVKPMGEVFPGVSRPIVEEQFIKVPGRWRGVGLLELMEPIQDLTKQTFDLMYDSGTLANIPFGFYRPQGMKQEVKRIAPGELHPLANPTEDVHFPNLPNSGQAFGFNLIALLTQWKERLTMVSELQLGRVPSGGSSALRTQSGMAAVLGQGEARPERILRRFFNALTKIWGHIHNLNIHFLPDEKQILVMGADDNAYQTIRRDDVQGEFQFDFKANVFNASRAARQSLMQTYLSIYATPLALQTGIIDRSGLYKLFRDAGKAFGGDPSIYLARPAPEDDLDPITAEEALIQIKLGKFPEGKPAEPEHLDKLQEFVQTYSIDEQQQELLQQWADKVIAFNQIERERQAMAQAAQQFAQEQQQRGQPEETESNAQVNENELIDERLPGA